MKTFFRSFFLIVIGSGLILGCSPAKQDAQTDSFGNIQPTTIVPTQLPKIVAEPTPTEVPYIIPPINFSTDMFLCAEENPGSDFLVTCSDSGLTVSQSPDRRKTDSIIRREIPISSERFSLSAEVVSQPANMDRLDQNQIGFYFTTINGKTFTVRVEGQYFNFEEWEITDGIKLADSFNKTFAPALNSAGRKNVFNYVCNVDFGCDLYGNDVLIGRSPYQFQDKITSLGFFTASNWDQQFGNILLNSFSVKENSSIGLGTQAFTLKDDLTLDNGTFSQMGLSGAFSEIEEDGFHFSPVIPYGFYAAKSGPSLSNVSISSLVSMEFSPGIQGTQYAGVVCRSSFDGRYIAIMRVDGTYTIYRDTLRYPFSLLAKGKIAEIQAGRSVNSLRLDCIDNTISLYINDKQVESFQDTRHGIRFGRAGLITKAGGAPYSNAIIFSDFEIEEIR